jgi:hypothetical protein
MLGVLLGFLSRFRGIALELRVVLPGAANHQNSCQANSQPGERCGEETFHGPSFVLTKQHSRENCNY